MSFSPLNNEDIVVSSDSIVSTLWSDDKTILNNFYKENTSTKPYIEVYSSDPNISSSLDVQFSIAYGNKYGSGSALINPLVPNNSITRVLYGQFRTLINGDENTDINFGNGNTVAEDIYIININRTRYKEKLFSPTFNLNLTGVSGTINLTNNSKDVTTISYCDAGRVFDVVSGSNGNAITTSNSTTPGYTASGSYGKFLPDVGLILLNPKALALPFVSGGINVVPGTAQDNVTLNQNNLQFFNAINSGSYFSLNSEETITSDYVFIRVRNNEFNYSTNPSIINDNGEFYYPSLVNNPQTFITTVGLYNNSNELLAVAKLSKPLTKDFTKEMLLRVKLDF